MTFLNPDYLVDATWLQDRLEDPTLRILDCTVFLRPPAEGADRQSWVTESGRANYAGAHIPGAAFADVITDLSDVSSRYPFTMPSAGQFARAMGAMGVGERTHVVCYDANLTMWASRVWWMLRAFGFDAVAVLDGGLRKWQLEGRPLSTEPSRYPPARFVPRPQPALIASKEEVVASIASGDVCVVNALTSRQHKGAGPSPYGRPGRIARSVNVSARHLLDEATGAYLPAAELRSRFHDVGAFDRPRVVTYCGGGIAATSDALVLTLLGHPNVAVYDGSLSEWASDPAMPMEVG